MAGDNVSYKLANNARLAVNVNVNNVRKLSEVCVCVMYTVGRKKHTKMCFSITFVNLDRF